MNPSDYNWWIEHQSCAFDYALALAAWDGLSDGPDCPYLDDYYI